MDLKFETVEIPETVTVRKENPFKPLIEDLEKNGGARAFTMPSKTDADDKAIQSAIGYVQRATQGTKFSARKKITKNGDNSTITVWLVDRITRKRGESDSASE